MQCQVQLLEWRIWVRPVSLQGKTVQNFACDDVKTQDCRAQCLVLEHEEEEEEEEEEEVEEEEEEEAITSSSHIRLIRWNSLNDNFDPVNLAEGSSSISEEVGIKVPFRSPNCDLQGEIIFSMHNSKKLHSL